MGNVLAGCRRLEHPLMRDGVVRDFLSDSSSNFSAMYSASLLAFS